MELLQIRYFLKVSELESMTAAARELHVAQPSLSKAISRLEDEIGVKLFDRLGRRIRLNDCGACFQRYARSALISLEDGVRSTKEAAGSEDRVVVLATSFAKRLPELVNSYAATHPDAKLKIVQITDREEIGRSMAAGEADICVSSWPVEAPGFENQLLAQDRMCLVAPEGHPLSQRGELCLQDAAHLPLVLSTAESALCDIVQQRFAKEGLAPNVVCECASSEITCRLVEGGSVFGFLPEYLSEYEYARGLSFVRLARPEMLRDVWVSFDSRRRLPKVAQELVEFVLGYHFG